MILPPGQFREHVVTAVEDDALGRLLDAAEAAITEVAGPPGADIVGLVEGGYNRIVLSRPAATIVAVREASGSTWNTALTATDYETLSGSVVRRISGRWAHRVEVTYTPADDYALRIQAQIKLVELELNNPTGIAQNTVGPFNEQIAAGYDEQRAAILSMFRHSPGMVVI
jgi:hypothetical protein